MIYTTDQRNDALVLIAEGKSNMENMPLYERLQEFGWINIKKSNGIASAVQLTYSGRDLTDRLIKAKAR